MTVHHQPTTSVLTFSSEMTIYTAVDSLHRLREHIATHDAVWLDLSQVKEFDSAGLQIVLAARLFAESHAMSFGVVSYSDVVKDVLDLLQLRQMLCVKHALNLAHEESAT
jgi:anti-anti-sigma factor